MERNAALPPYHHRVICQIELVILIIEDLYIRRVLSHKLRESPTSYALLLCDIGVFVWVLHTYEAQPKVCL